MHSDKTAARRPQVLAIAPVFADRQTAQLGIAFDANGYGTNGNRMMRASLIAGGQVFTFNVSGTGGQYPSMNAALIESSPVIGQDLQAWWYGGF
jgi:hypothetical protein